MVALVDRLRVSRYRNKLLIESCHHIDGHKAANLFNAMFGADWIAVIKVGYFEITDLAKDHFTVELDKFLPKDAP